MNLITLLQREKSLQPFGFVPIRDDDSSPRGIDSEEKYEVRLNLWLTN